MKKICGWLTFITLLRENVAWTEVSNYYILSFLRSNRKKADWSVLFGNEYKGLVSKFSYTWRSSFTETDISLLRFFQNFSARQDYAYFSILLLQIMTQRYPLFNVRRTPKQNGTCQRIPASRIFSRTKRTYFLFYFWSYNINHS